MLRAEFAALVAGVAVTLSACSEVVPGLNVKLGDDGGATHSAVSFEQDAPPSYVIMPIGPRLIRDLRERAGNSNPLAGLTPVNIATRLPEYQVGSGDVLFVTVWDHPELSAPVGGQVHDLIGEGRLVRADGTIFFPFAGDVVVEGKTTRQIGAELARRMASSIKDPQVDVRVTAYRSKRIQVSGSVLKPGMITLDDSPKGISEAIAESGGLTPLASRRQVLLVRSGQTYVVDRSEHPASGMGSQDIELQPGDRIDVPDQSGDQVFVLGAVNKQQPVVIMQNSMTLMEALTDAGGLDSVRGKGSGVLVFRPSYSPSGRQADIFTLDMSEPQGVLLAGEFQVEPRDVVYVQATGFSQFNSVVSQLLPTVQTLFDAVEAQYLLKSRTP